MSVRLLKKSHAAAWTMLQAQANLPPMIIHTLQALLDRGSFSPGHVKWVEDGVRAMLANWERTEDLKQLKRDLGLDAGKRRRRTLTMRRETALAASVVNAAMGGDANPKKAAGDEHQADEREVQRAWKKWSPIYLARLELAKPHVTREERRKIRAAIAVLKPRRPKRRDKK